MFSYFAKGYTVGRIISGRILRTLTGLPGLVLDGMLAFFWIPDYTSYWDKYTTAVIFMDGRRTTSVLYGVFGYIGELASYLLAPAFGLVGAALYIPDLMLRAVLFSYNKFRETLSNFAILVGNTPELQKYFASPPESYLDKAWNLGTFLGLAIGFIPSLPARVIDFFLPFLDLTSFVKGGFALTGAVAGYMLGLIIYLPQYFVQKSVELLQLARNTVSNAVAFVYAWGNVSLQRTYYNKCCPPLELHTPEFEQSVRDYNSTTMWDMLCGTAGEQTTSAPPNPPPYTDNTRLFHPNLANTPSAPPAPYSGTWNR